VVSFCLKMIITKPKTPQERGLTCSNELRYVERTVETGTYILNIWPGGQTTTSNYGTLKTFLQQKWYGPREEEWHDVPTAKEEKK